jgi:hypothetical protein
MSKYTTNFKTLIQMEIVTRDYIEDIFKDYELTDYLTPEEVQVITTRGTWSKDKLARKIVDHYYFKDIGFETIGMFKHYAKIQMQEIMESKLPLIYSAAIHYDPLVNVDYTETLSRNVTSEQSSNGSGLVINSDTPQTNINKNNLLNGSYASTASATDQEASGNNTTDEDYTKTIKGNSGVSATAQKMVEQYRDNIRAIDYEIIKELNDLFMGLF